MIEGAMLYAGSCALIVGGIGAVAVSYARGRLRTADAIGDGWKKSWASVHLENLTLQAKNERLNERIKELIRAHLRLNAENAELTEQLGTSERVSAGWQRSWILLNQQHDALNLENEELTERAKTAELRLEQSVAQPRGDGGRFAKAECSTEGCNRKPARGSSWCMTCRLVAEAQPLAASLDKTEQLP